MKGMKVWPKKPRLPQWRKIRRSRVPVLLFLFPFPFPFLFLTIHAGEVQTSPVPALLNQPRIQRIRKHNPSTIGGCIGNQSIRPFRPHGLHARPPYGRAIQPPGTPLPKSQRNHTRPLSWQHYAPTSHQQSGTFPKRKPTQKSPETSSVCFLRLLACNHISGPHTCSSQVRNRMGRTVASLWLTASLRLTPRT